MAKTSPEESVMRYFETQPIEKAEVMLAILNTVIKRRINSESIQTSVQKTYLDPHVANLKKKGQKIKKAHISEIGGYPVPQLAPDVPGLFNAMYANAVQATMPSQAPFQHASPGEITLKTIQANMDAMGVGSSDKHSLHGAYAPGEKPGVDGSVYPSYAELQKPEPQFQSLALSDAEFKKMAEGLAEKEKKAKKKAELDEPPF